jgi:hypothetical protein
MTTVIEAIQDIATRNSSTRKDEAVVNYMLSRLNIDGKVVSGIVYIAPYNTAPTDIHTFCKTLIKTFKDQGLI